MKNTLVSDVERALNIVVSAAAAATQRCEDETPSRIRANA